MVALHFNHGTAYKGGEEDQMEALDANKAGQVLETNFCNLGRSLL